VPPKHPKEPKRPTIYNFITADDYITRLRDPSVPVPRKRQIVEELSVCDGLIKRAQQAELCHALADLREKSNGDGELRELIQEALLKIEQARFID
jgi:hypothetical protein